jgi:hypothetical protein
MNGPTEMARRIPTEPLIEGHPVHLDIGCFKAEHKEYAPSPGLSLRRSQFGWASIERAKLSL